jgi:hypothetical protein
MALFLVDDKSKGGSPVFQPQTPAAGLLSRKTGMAPFLDGLMKNRRNYYRILQVQPDAPFEVIRASYRALMRELRQHPDLGGSTSEASIINEAYATLSNPDRRATYDKAMAAHYTRRTGAADRPASRIEDCPVCEQPMTRRPQAGESCPTCRTPLRSQRPADLDKACERSLPRMKSDDRIGYYPVWPGKARPGRMVDISPKGMRFLCGEKLPPKTVLKISSRQFEASGAVTNVGEVIVGGRRLFAVGICFLAISFAESKGTFLSTSA